jgi:predicted nucleic acid-binding protein
VNPLVVDASLALSWVFADEATAETDAIGCRVAEHGAWAPALWRLEVANALLVAERRGRIGTGQAEAKLADLEAMGIATWDRPQGAPSVIALARKHSLSSYDAAYLGLALTAAADLGTLDAALARAARTEGLAALPALAASPAAAPDKTEEPAAPITA